MDMSDSSHTLKHAPLGIKSVIPEGRKDYEAYYFNHSLSIGSARDPFRDELTNFVIDMFRGQGIKERVSDPNNKYNSIQIKVSQEGIRFSWYLSRTRGIRQWMTGDEEEKIAYYQIGLTPLPREKQPDGYWEYIQLWIENAIESNEDVNMERSIGGFAIRKSHKLY